MSNLPAKNRLESIRNVQCGDMFRVGKHIVACGDARDAEFVRRVVGGRAIAAVVCDPPYGVKAVEGKRGFSQLSVSKNILNDDITDEAQYAKFTKDWIIPILPHLDRKNSFYVFNADPNIFALREGMRASGVRFSQLLVWVKNHGVVGRKDYLIRHELVAYGWYGVHAFRKAKDASVLFCPKPSRSPLHPTQKPVALLRRIVLNSTAAGDVVYDCFAGSGSTGIAAEMTKRSSVLIERDEEYVDTILRRFEKIFGMVPEQIHE